MEIYYSIENCGDGSASVGFFETSLAARLHQELHILSEGWAEECNGSFTVTGSDLRCDVLRSNQQLADELRDMMEWVEGDDLKEYLSAIEQLESS